MAVPEGAAGSPPRVVRWWVGWAGVDGPSSSNIFLVITVKSGLPKRRISSRSSRKKSPKKIGLLGEEAVIRKLRKSGWRIPEYNPSYGKTDVFAKKGSRKWLIQVKTSTNKGNRKLSSNELRALKSRATKIGAVPVLAYVNISGGRSSIKFISLRDERELKP